MIYDVPKVIPRNLSFTDICQDVVLHDLLLVNNVQHTIVEQCASYMHIAQSYDIELETLIDMNRTHSEVRNVLLRNQYRCFIVKRLNHEHTCYLELHIPLFCTFHALYRSRFLTHSLFSLSSLF